MRNAECGMRNAECGMRNAECGMRNAECGMRNAECGMRNAECGMRKCEMIKRKDINSEFRIPNSEFPKLSSGDFARLSRFIYETCGINMTATKKTMLEARLHKRLRALGMKSYGDYCAYLFGATGGDEVVRMIDLATTNKTDFFRESEHFSYLTQRVLPEWLHCFG